MPDHRRFCAPESTIPYQYFIQEKQKAVHFENGKRKDDRLPKEHRKIFMKTSVVSQAKGSAYIEVGKTKVIVSVFDPREIPNKIDYSQKGELYCDFKYAPFSCQLRRSHQQDAEEKQNSILMKQALEPAVCRHEFPNFQVDIYAIVLENDGSALSAAITVAGVALVQAGVPMYDLIASSSMAILNNTELINPTFEEEQICKQANKINKHHGKQKRTIPHHGQIIFTMLSNHQQITQFHQTGNLPLNLIEESVQTLTDTCKEIFPLIEKCLVKYTLKNMKLDHED